MIEKLFGWMKLDNEQSIEEFSNIDTDGIKCIQSETEIIKTSAYSIATSVQNINENRVSNEDTLQAEIPQEEAAPEETIKEDYLIANILFLTKKYFYAWEK